MFMIMEAAYLRIQLRPLIDQRREVVAVVECNQRALIAYGVPMVFRLSVELYPVVPIESPSFAVDLLFIGGNGEDIGAVITQRPLDVCKDQGGSVDVLHDIKRNHYIETGLTERRAFEVFVPNTTESLTELVLAKELGWCVALSLACQFGGYASLAWRGLMDVEFSPVGELAFQNIRKGSLSGN